MRSDVNLECSKLSFAEKINNMNKIGSSNLRLGSDDVRNAGEMKS